MPAMNSCDQKAWADKSNCGKRSKKTQRDEAWSIRCCENSKCRACRGRTQQGLDQMGLANWAVPPNYTRARSRQAAARHLRGCWALLWAAARSATTPWAGGGHERMSGGRWGRMHKGT